MEGEGTNKQTVMDRTDGDECKGKKKPNEHNTTHSMVIPSKDDGAFPPFADS